MNNTEKMKLNKNTIIISIVALIVIITLTILYLNNRAEMQVLVNEMVEEKEILTEEYKNLALGYDSLKTNSDTLNTLLQKDRERIEQLLEEIQTVKATNAAKIREYKKELATLRGVLKHYVVQIDSLNQTNEALKKENSRYKRRVITMKTSNKKLIEEKKKLTEKVEIASKLETENIKIMGLNSRGRKTFRSSRISKIKVYFTIKKNITAKVGKKDIYIRLTRPDGSLLYHSKQDVFVCDGTKINFSAKREIEYGGEQQEVDVFYKVDDGELSKGRYVVDIFADERHIGNADFNLK